MRLRFFAAIAIVLTFCLIGHTQTPAAKAVQGDAAIKQLKDQGRFNSLMDAVRSAEKNSSHSSPNSPDAAIIESHISLQNGAISDYFGCSVAIYEDTAVVGAFGRGPGQTVYKDALFVFHRNGDNWLLEASLSSQLYRSANDYFGYSVAIYQDLIAVGVPLADVYNGSGYDVDRGEAFVFEKINNVWTPHNVVLAPDGQPGDHFGTSVSLVYHRLAVGAPFDQVGSNGRQGSVYVFDAQPQVPVMTHHITASDGAFGDQFGESVCAFGFYSEYIVAGAPLDDIAGNSDQGSAYIFSIDYNDQSLHQVSKLTGPDGAADDNFGHSVGMAYGAVAVGAPYRQVGTNAGQGAVYTFDSTGGFNATIVDPFGQAFDSFGSSVSVSYSGKVAIGAEGHYNYRGEAFIYERVNNAWSQVSRIFAGDGQEGDWFGHSIGFDGNNLIAGAWQDVVNGNSGQGSAYIYRVASSYWNVQPKTDSGVVSYDNFGYAVSLDGNTAVIGVPLADNGQSENTGRAFVFVRNAGEWAIEAQLIPPSNIALDQFGCSVSISGDTAVIGSPFKQIGPDPGVGVAYVYTRVAGVWSLQSTLSAADPAADDRFASSVDIYGDDIVVGAPNKDVGGVGNAGAIYVFSRSGNSWTQAHEYQDPQAVADANLGRSVAISGNTVIAGEPQQTVSGLANAGRVLVFDRVGNAWGTPNGLTSPTVRSDYYYGSSVDIDSTTLIAGAVGSSTVPSAYVLTRTAPDTWTEEFTLFPPSGPSPPTFTTSVSIKGNDVAVGLPYHNSYTGDVVVARKTAGVWQAQHLPLPPENGYFGGHGQSVAVDGDTIISGFPTATISGSIAAGAAVVSVRNGNAFTREALLTRSFAGDNANYGYSVDIDAGIAVVGAPGQTVGSNAQQGAVYVLEQVNGLWSATAQITAADGEAGDHFGSVVRKSGDTIAVGAPSQLSSTGAAYIFVKSGTVWSQQVKLLSPFYPVTGGNFGATLDIEHDDLVIGSPYTSSAHGNVHIYHREKGTWISDNFFTSPAFHYFGTSVAIHGDIISAGVPGNAATSDPGFVKLLVRNNGIWGFGSSLNPTTQANAFCGASTSISDYYILIGCKYDESAGITSGSVYAFPHIGLSIQSPIKLTAPNPQQYDFFGASVAESGGIIVVGSPGKTINGNFGQGAAYIFYQYGPNITQLTDLTAADGAQNDNFGFAVGIDKSKIVVGSYGSDFSPYGFRTGKRSMAPATAGQDRGAMYTYQNQIVASPTAARVSISGKLSDTNGRSIGSASVEVRNSEGRIIGRAISNAFGYYRIDGIEVGSSYLVSIASKRYSFPTSPRLISLVDELTDLDFIGERQ